MSNPAGFELEAPVKQFLGWYLIRRESDDWYESFFEELRRSDILSHISLTCLNIPSFIVEVSIRHELLEEVVITHSILSCFFTW